MTGIACQSKSGPPAFSWMPSPRLQHVGRVWSFEDSVEWKSKRDSLLTAVIQLGGDPVVCKASPTNRRFSANALYWRYKDYYLKIRAEKISRDYLGRPWVVSLEGYSVMPFECLNRPS